MGGRAVDASFRPTRGKDTEVVNPAEKIYFLAVGLLALWVGFWGYFAPARVDKAIPFLVPPLHARFIGAIYLSGLVFMVAGMVVPRWADLRFVPLLTALWTGGLLVVSLLHLEEFDFSKPQSQVWFAAYIVYPLIALGLAWRHGLFDDSRFPDGEAPGWVRHYLTIQGGIMTSLAAVLLLAPSVMVNVWPWDITPLLAQIYAAPFLSYGVCSILMAPRSSSVELRVAAVAFLVFTAGVLLASIIHVDLFSAGDVSDILWFTFFVCATVVLALLTSMSMRTRTSPAA
jgi:hypothetical protein